MKRETQEKLSHIMAWVCTLALLGASVLMAMSTFAATVTGTLNLSWEAPTENTDGTPLTNLAGYSVHIGTQPGVYDTEIPIPNASATSETLQIPISDQADGEVTVYIAMRAINDEQVASDYSNELSKTFTLIENPKVTLPPILQNIEFQLECVSDDSALTCTIQ